MRSSSSHLLAAHPRLGSRSISRVRVSYVAFPRWKAGCDRRRGYASSAPARSGDERPPFRFDTSLALFAKRAPRPFPPPFTSPPSISFSDALSTHHQNRDRRVYVRGDLIRGQTNGDDAVYASDRFICANDGVGAWAARPRGHAGWVRNRI